MNVVGVLAVSLIPLGLFTMIFGIIYMYKKENLAMIEKGMNPKFIERRPTPYRNLKWGLLLVGSGTGLTLAYIITQYVLHDTEDPALWFAFIAIGGGLGLIQSYKIEKKEVLDKEFDKKDIL